MLQNSRKNIFRVKQTTNKVPLIFLDVKVLLRKRNNYIFGLSQQTIKVQCMYLAFQNVEICWKKGQQLWES